MKTFRRYLGRQRNAPRTAFRFVLQWHITHRCDHRCLHCYQDTYGGDELSADALRDIPRQFNSILHLLQSRHADRAVSGQITITGGEPFLYHDFPALIDGLRREYSGIDIAFLTNGCGIDGAGARWVAGMRPGFVQLSIDGAEETHDRMRGAGDFHRVLRTLSHLQKAGVHTLLSFTAHKGNYREFEAVAQAALRSGVRRVWADRWLPIGTLSLHGGSVLTPAETHEFFVLMHAARKTLRRKFFAKTEVAMHRALQFLVAGGRPYACQAGRSLLAVMPDGEVYPCRRLPISVGNIFDQPLETIYLESPLLRRLRDAGNTPALCRDCLYGSLCRGGLRCLSHAMTGDPFGKDPGCWHDAGNRLGLSIC